VHPLFLRGIPYLSKLMKRCTSERERQVKRLDLEDLDLDVISSKYPVPEHYTDDAVLLPCILQDGPKARMPVVTQWTPKLSDFGCQNSIQNVKISMKDTYGQNLALSSHVNTDGENSIQSSVSTSPVESVCLDMKYSASRMLEGNIGHYNPTLNMLDNHADITVAASSDRDSSSEIQNVMALMQVWHQLCNHHDQKNVK
jgi:hypothetical protein